MFKIHCSSPESACLENKPEGLPHFDGRAVIMQGMYIDATQQCQHLHGKDAKANPKFVNKMVSTQFHEHYLFFLKRNEKGNVFIDVGLSASSSSFVIIT